MADRICKDCPPAKKKPRPAPHPGPRCATHDRVERKRRKAQAHDRRIQNVYGLPPGEYERLKAFQGGVCALCQRANGRTKALAVDHDHSCCAGKTSCGECPRGLLCSNCNSTLAHARDDVGFFERAAAYLANPPYKQMRSQASE